MDRYTIYCTKEQTKKAFELGAPIVTLPNYEELNGFPFVRCKNGNGYPCQIPTAEQMIGWLEDMGISVKAVCFSWCNENKPTWQVHAYQKSTNFWDEIAFGHSRSYREATLAAIDAALDYLANRKEE